MNELLLLEHVDCLSVRNRAFPGVRKAQFYRFSYICSLFEPGFSILYYILQGMKASFDPFLDINVIDESVFFAENSETLVRAGK